MKEQWREAEVWHCGKPREAIAEDNASVAEEAPELKKSYRDVEVWHHDKIIRMAISGSAAQLQKTPAFGRCQNHKVTTKNSSTGEVKSVRI